MSAFTIMQTTLLDYHDKKTKHNGSKYIDKILHIYSWNPPLY